MNIIALIPAKSTSTRIPDKNIKTLAGHPLMAYSIGVAKQSGIFDRILVSTDSERYARIAERYGADVRLRSPELSVPSSPDVDWLYSLVDILSDYEAFAILRPTSPFRTADMLRRAWFQFQRDTADSLRAVQACHEHPGKMWVVHGNRMSPLLPFSIDDIPWHSNQTQRLPTIHVQNASLEIARVSALFETGRMSGYTVAPFFTKGCEGFDINDMSDWERAEQLIADGVELPIV